MTKQSENGSEAKAPELKITALESKEAKAPEVKITAPESKEAKAPENKTSEEATKGLDPRVIRAIESKVTELFKNGIKEADAFTQIQASNQDIQLSTLQMIFKKIAEILTNNANANNANTNLRSTKIEDDPLINFARELEKYCKTQERPGDEKKGDAIKPPATIENEKSAKDLKSPNLGTNKIVAEEKSAQDQSKEKQSEGPAVKKLEQQRQDNSVNNSGRGM